MPRAEFSKSVKRQAYERSQGRCEAVGVWYGLPPTVGCNADLRSTGVEYDHIIRAADGGSNDLDNCRAVCPPCHKHKTRILDTPQAAKTKRMSDKDKGIRRRKQPIKSRGFAKAPKADKGDLPQLPPRRLYESQQSGDGQ